MAERPLIDSVSVRFIQDGNTLGTTEECETLTVRLETQLPGDKPFVVIQTENGWSFDETDELVALVEHALMLWDGKFNE